VWKEGWRRPSPPGKGVARASRAAGRAAGEARHWSPFPARAVGRLSRAREPCGVLILPRRHGRAHLKSLGRRVNWQD
jgi:hypothetical protein